MVTRVKLSSWNSGDNLKYVSVIDYGAKGDGSADDTAAFVAALAVGSPVFVPAGTYIVSGISVPANVSMAGSGRASVIKLKSTSTLPVLSIGAGTDIKDLKIDGNKAAQTVTCHGILATDAIQSSIENVTITNTKGDGINVTGTNTNYLQVTNCLITGFTKNGILVEAGKLVSIDTCYAGNSDAVASPGDGFSIASNGSTLNNISLVGCVSTGNVGRGYSIVGNTSKNVTDTSISDCHAFQNTSHGFHLLTTERDQLTTCTAKTNGGDGFRVEGDVQHCRLSLCNAHNNTGYGIREVTAGSTPNFNGFIYSITRNNGNDTVTKVGANSTVVSI